MSTSPPRVSIFGAGYVGVVTAACLVEQGAAVTLVDVSPAKMEKLGRGLSPIVEPGVEERLQRGLAAGLLAVETDGERAVANTDTSIVCVGTPSRESGEMDSQYIERVSASIAAAIAKKNAPHRVIYRSTMAPGWTRRLAADYFGDVDVQPIFVPEFLREGTAVKDFLQPSLCIVGVEDGQTCDLAGLQDKLFGNNAPQVVRWEEAELVKYACNAFHALKVAFANEMGRFSKAYGADARRVMSVLCEDKQLNISPYYLRPGAPFGGSCLPKDVNSLTFCAGEKAVNLPVVSALVPSNERHLQMVLDQIEGFGDRKIGVIGLSFKMNTDDLRNSPAVRVAADLIRAGREVSIYDPKIKPEDVHGASRDFAFGLIEDLPRYLNDDLADCVTGADLLIVFQKCADLDVLRDTVGPDQVIVDLTDWPELEGLPARYHGLCW